MQDLKNNIGVVQSLAPAARDADANGTGVDLQGFESATVVIDMGAEGITLSTTNKIEIELTCDLFCLPTVVIISN